MNKDKRAESSVSQGEGFRFGGRGPEVSKSGRWLELPGASSEAAATISSALPLGLCHPASSQSYEVRHADMSLAGTGSWCCCRW